MTWGEAERFYNFYHKDNARNFQIVSSVAAMKILETVHVAQHGKKHDIMKLFRRLRQDALCIEKEEEINEIESQFEGVDFG